MLKLQKFTIERFKKDGTPMTPVKIKKGIWVEPHTQEQYDKNIQQNLINKEQGIKDRFIYYPGTKIPHIHYMELKKKDPYSYTGGGPMPWADPSTIEINEALLSTEDIYNKLEKAKLQNDKEQIEFLTRPLVTWRCPQTFEKKALYAQSVIISNRNDKSDFVYENLQRFEDAIKKLEEIYLKERLNSIRGVSALVNLLSSKFAFRVGNQLDKTNTGIGVTTLRNDNIYIDEKNILHFKFKGKRDVRWHKKFIPQTDLEKAMFDDLAILKNKNNEFIFYCGPQRITSIETNELFREVFDVKLEERDYLSFHSWRHYNASKAFLKFIQKLNLDREFKKIEKKKDINTNVKKARLLTKEINDIFKKVAPILNDTPGVVKSTYSGGKIFKEIYDKCGIEFDEKKRTFDKNSYSGEIEAEKVRREQRKIERLQKQENKNEIAN